MMSDIGRDRFTVPVTAAAARTFSEIALVNTATADELLKNIGSELDAGRVSPWPRSISTMWSSCGRGRIFAPPTRITLTWWRTGIQSSGCAASPERQSIW